MLSFQAETSPLFVQYATFASESAIEEVSRIDLNTRLVGQHTQDASTAGFVNFRGQDQGAVAFPVGNPIVVVTSCQLQLLIVGGNSRAHRRSLSEIQGRALHAANFSRGDEVGIHRSEIAGMNGDLVPENIAFALTGKVEVGMIGQIDDRGLIRSGGIINLQFVLAGYGVNHLGGEIAGITLFAVGAEVSQFKRITGNFLGCLQSFVKSRSAAMKTVVAVVAWQGVINAVQAEPAVRDAVGEAADNGAEVRLIGFITGD